MNRPTIPHMPRPPRAQDAGNLAALRAASTGRNKIFLRECYAPRAAGADPDRTGRTGQGLAVRRGRALTCAPSSSCPWRHPARTYPLALLPAGRRPAPRPVHRRRTLLGLARPSAGRVLAEHHECPQSGEDVRTCAGGSPRIDAPQALTGTGPLGPNARNGCSARLATTRPQVSASSGTSVRGAPTVDGDAGRRDPVGDDLQIPHRPAARPPARRSSCSRPPTRSRRPWCCDRRSGSRRRGRSRDCAA